MRVPNRSFPSTPTLYSLHVAWHFDRMNTIGGHNSKPDCRKKGRNLMNISKPIPSRRYTSRRAASQPPVKPWHPDTRSSPRWYSVLSILNGPGLHPRAQSPLRNCFPMSWKRLCTFRKPMSTVGLPHLYPPTSIPPVFPDFTQYMICSRKSAYLQRSSARDM